MNRLLATLAALLLLAAAPAAAQLPRLELTAGFHRIEAEVAADPNSRQQGLMHRRTMETNDGMLFVFTLDERHCMWMRNTLLPLAVAFLDLDGRVINIEEMKPQTEINHCAAKPASYALEMNAGWFAQRGIKPGQKIGGIDRAPRAR